MNSKLLIILMLALVVAAASPTMAGKGDALYEQARKAYDNLMNDEDAKASRGNWLKVIGMFESVYQTDPSSKSAPKAYFTAGKLCYNAYKYHKNRADLDRGIRNLDAFVRKYPSNSLADDAEYYIGELYFKAGDEKRAAYHYKIVVERFPDGDMSRDARQRLEQLKMWPIPAWLKTYKPSGTVVATPQQPNPKTAEPPTEVDPYKSHTSGRALIKQIKYLSSGEYTRVVITSKNKVKHSEIQYIKPNPETKAGPKLFLDIFDSRLAPGVDRPQEVNDGLLLKVRAGQFTPDTVRVVLEIDSIDNEQTKVFPMEETGGDYKIVIDVSAPKKKTTRATTPAAPIVAPPKKTIRRIVLDAGHGGKDPGAIGPTGLHEKDVVLAIAIKTRDILSDMGYDVSLTREKDQYLPLEERTAYANVVHIEDQTVFVSLHANAAEDSSATGIETYILDVTDNHAAKRLAAVENKVSIETINEFQSEQGLIFALFQKAKADESYNFALDIQGSLVAGASDKYKNVKDHGVKEAPFFVLMGAKMPCVLVELSFISNPTEEKRLRSDAYRDILAESLADGINNYVKKKTALASAPIR